MFPNFVEVAFVRDVLCIPGMHSPLVTRAMCSKGAPDGLHGLLCGGDSSCVTTGGGVLGVAGPCLGWLPVHALCGDC